MHHAKKRRGFAALILALIAMSTIVGSGTALASPPAPGTAQAKPDGAPAALAPCIAQALKLHANAWTCTGAGLTAVDATGKETFTAIAPAVAERVDPAPGNTTQADDYDTWCENGSICHRKINDYAAETKGNAAYGDQSGVIGSWDSVIRTGLNGRQAQWRVTLIWDSGPALQFYDVYVHCKEEINNWPDTNCGDHYAGAPYLRTYYPYYRWDANVIYGNRLVDSDEYYANLDMLFDPDGNYTTHTAGTLKTMLFNCYGTNNCVFP